MNKEAKAAYQKEIYYWKKSHGICVDCGCESANVGVRCEVCAAKQAESRQRYYENMSPEKMAEFKAKRKARRKAQRDERKAKELCVQCGKPVFQNHSLCYEHWIYIKRYRKKKADENRKGYAEIGLCRICGKPQVKGKKLCEAHLKQYQIIIERNDPKRKANKDDN